MKQMNKMILDLTRFRNILEQAGLPWKISETVELTRRESLQLINALANPVHRNEKFIKAVAEFSEKATHLPEGVTVIRDSEPGAVSGHSENG